MINLSKVLVLVLIVSVKGQDTVNENLYDSKNFINANGNNLISRLISERKFNTEILKNMGKESDTVNHYEDITILDDNGQLKNLKYKSANKMPSVTMDDTKNDDKVIDSVKNQVEVPVTLSEIDETKYELSGHKTFDEIGPITCTKEVGF